MSDVFKWVYRLWVVLFAAFLVFAVWALAKANDDDYDGFDYFGVALFIDIVIMLAGFWLIDRLKGRFDAPADGN